MREPQAGNLNQALGVNTQSPSLGGDWCLEETEAVGWKIVHDYCRWFFCAIQDCILLMSLMSDIFKMMERKNYPRDNDY